MKQNEALAVENAELKAATAKLTEGLEPAQKALAVENENLKAKLTKALKGVQMEARSAAEKEQALTEANENLEAAAAEKASADRGKRKFESKAD